MLSQALADRDSARGEESVGHAAADHQMIDLGDQVPEDVELRRDLGAAHNRRHRPFGVAERLFQRFELGLHRPAGERRETMRDSLGGGMGAMGGGESVVDIEVAEAGEALDDRRIVLLLAAEEAGIFENGDIARLKVADCRHIDLPVDEPYRPPQYGFIGLRDQGERIFGRRRLGSAEMGQKQDDGALVRQFGDGREGGAKTRVVTDLPFLHRHVEVDAHKCTLALHITQIIERSK